MPPGWSKTSIRALQRAVVEGTAVWGSPTPNNNIRIRDEQESLIRIHQIGNEAVSSVAIDTRPLLATL